MSSLSRYFYLGLNIWGIRSCQIQKPTVCAAAKAKNWNKRSHFETIQTSNLPLPTTEKRNWLQQTTHFCKHTADRRSPLAPLQTRIIEWSSSLATRGCDSNSVVSMWQKQLCSRPPGSLMPRSWPQSLHWPAGISACLFLVTRSLLNIITRLDL